MKKRISVLLFAVILTECPFAFAMQTFSMPATVEGSIFGGQPSDRIAVKVTSWKHIEDCYYSPL